MNSHEVKSKAPENVCVSQLPNFPYLSFGTKNPIFPYYRREEGEGVCMSLIGLNKYPEYKLDTKFINNEQFNEIL